MPRSRLLLPILLVTVGLILSTSPAEAGRKWCHRDPVFNIGGTLVAVDVAVYDDQQAHVTGPVQVTLNIPSSINASLVTTDQGFNNLGEATSIVVNKRLKVTSRGAQIEVKVNVPADIRMQVNVTLTPGSNQAATVIGITNSTLSITKVVALAK